MWRFTRQVSQSIHARHYLEDCTRHEIQLSSTSDVLIARRFCDVVRQVSILYGRKMAAVFCLFLVSPLNPFKGLRGLCRQSLAVSVGGPVDRQHSPCCSSESEICLNLLIAGASPVTTPLATSNVDETMFLRLVAYCTLLLLTSMTATRGSSGPPSCLPSPRSPIHAFNAGE